MDTMSMHLDACLNFDSGQISTVMTPRQNKNLNYETYKNVSGKSSVSITVLFTNT